MVKRNKFILLLVILIFSLNFSLRRKYDFYRAKTFYLKGDYKKALILYSQYLKGSRKSLTLYYNIGTVYLKMKEYELAEKYLIKVIKGTNEKSLKKRALFNLAYIMYKKGEKEKALTLFKESAIIDSEDIVCKKNIELLLNKNEKEREKKGEDRKRKKNKNIFKKEDSQIINYIKDAERMSLKKFLSRREKKESGDKDW